MKKLIIAAAALMVSLAVYGQGQVSINNRVGSEVNARLVAPGDAPGSSSIGSPDWTVNLLGGPVGGTLSPLDPASTTLRGAAGTSAAGFFTGVTATVPGVAVGGNADILLRVNGPGGVSVDFGPFTVNGLGGVPATGAPIVPPNAPLGTANLVVPEPTTLALGALGLGALLFIRRRK
jgi:hypothetical protein